MVPFLDNNGITPSYNINETAMNVYELPKTQELVQFQHAALGFPTKATLLTSIRNNNLVTFPGMTADNIRKFFPQSSHF